MPKILRIINRFNLGGPTYNAAYLTKYLPPEFETTLVGGMWDESEEGSQHILDSLGIEPIILPEMRRSISISRDRAAYQRIKRIIQQLKPDIVHTHASKAGAVGRLAASDLNVPVVIHTFHGHVFHSYFNSVKSNLYKNIERYLAKRSSRIIAISEKQKQELADEHRICPESKITVIPLGFDLDRFRTDLTQKRALFRQVYNVKDDEIAIGIIGRLVPIKDHSSFMRAIDLVKQRTSKKIRVFIVGDGEERQQIEELAQELNLSYGPGPLVNGHTFSQMASMGHCLNGNAPLVTFTSWIKDVDVVNAGLDIVALSSLNEGTPVSLIEAQATNKPIVSTNVGGIENVVIPGNTALLSPPSDPEKLAEHLLMLVEDEGLRRRMGERGWAHVKERYHYERLVNDTQALYYSLLN